MSCRLLVLAALAGFVSAASAHAADRKTFALVPKAVGVPFYADAEKGCEAEAAKLGATCLFTGPPQLDDAAQANIVRDLVTRGVAGIAIAPSNGASIAKVITLARSRHIPVVTFDSDAPGSQRTAFIGTDNKSAGHLGGETFARALPQGGTYAVLTGGLSAANLNDRIAGFKSALGGNFKEVAGSPFACNDDSSACVQDIQDILARYPHLDGIFFSGGWPMFAPSAFKAAVRGRLADLKTGKFVIVSFDTLPAQIKLLQEGYATALIGQRPYAMGADAIDQLDALSDGKTVPPVTDTGVDLVTQANVPQFAGAK